MTNLRLDPGTAAPDFTLHDQDNAPLALADLRGQKTILYFYPAAMTAGCTTQACDFRDSIASLQGAGYRVVGISRDDPKKLAEFRKRDDLTFTLLSDPDHAVHTAYGVWGENELRQDHRRRDPLDVRPRRGQHDHRGDVQRQSHWPCGSTA